MIDRLTEYLTEHWKEGRVSSGPQLRLQSQEWERHGVGAWGSWSWGIHSQWGSNERWSLLLSLSFLLSSEPQPSNGATHTESGMSLFSGKYPKTPSQTYSEICLLGGCKFNQADSEEDMSASLSWSHGVNNWAEKGCLWICTETGGWSDGLLLKSSCVLAEALSISDVYVLWLTAACNSRSRGPEQVFV